MGKSNVPVRHIRGEGVKDKRDGVVSIDTNTYKMYVGDGIEAHQIEAGGGGGASMIETTYAELVEKRDNAQLQAGCLYRITDYECTSSDEETQCAGHNYDIIVTALSSDTLGEECRAIQHEGDTYFNSQNLNSWKVWYCLDNGRTSWGKEEGEFVRVNYYGDIVRCKIVDKTSSDYDGLPIKTTSIFYGEKIELYLPLNYEGFDIDGFVVYSDGYEEEATFDSAEYLGVQVGGKGVVYRLIDDKGNDVSYDFKNLMFKRYKITSEDYLFFDMCKGVKNNENYEIDEEDYKFFYTFSVGEEEGSIEDYSMSSFVYDNKLNVKETYNNIFSNTFGSYCYSNTFGSYCYSNTFGEDCRYNTFGEDCRYNTFGSGCYYNTFGSGCYYNTFGLGCNSNTFGDSCYYNTFGSGCYYNTFGSGCDSNTFGNYCDSNTFGENCYYNTFGIYCSSNTFGNYCNSNTFGENCYYNKFGEYCYSNTFGEVCHSNTFRDDCRSNTFGSDCYYNTLGNYCDSNTFDVTKKYNSCVVLDMVNYVNFSFVDYQGYYPNKHVQYCGYNSQGVLKYWTPADLVQ